MAKFIRFLGPDGPTYGRVEDDVVYTLSGDLFGWWEETGEGFLLDGLKLLPPCSPGKMLAVGFNYRDHAEEFHTPIPTDPNIFLKPPSCLAAHGQKVLYPRALTRQVEYEAELVVVIGRHARHVTPEQAPDYIIRRLQCRDVVVQGNPRVFKALRNHMEDIYEELKRLECCSEANDELLYTIQLIAETMNGLQQDKED